MNLLLAAIKREFPDWNRRAFTMEDFYRYCRRKGIRVHEIPLLVPAFYGVKRGRPHIYLDSRTRGVARLHAAWHELAHYLLHTPPYESVTYYYRLKPQTREEIEADAFASVALIPESLLKRLLAAEEYAEDHGLSAELLKERCALFARYGI